jgi:hypothetical protein
MWGALSDEKLGLYFSLLPGIASAAFFGSESHGTHEHSLLSLFLIFPQPGGPGSSIYFPQEQGSLIILSGIGSSLYSPDTDCTEKVSSIIAVSLDARGTTAVTQSSAYTAVTSLLVYKSQ